ncbi:TetR/AcrR family transcriptional regulator [Teredinibacter turnerae]|uniref:TetR/AcrR family transcriptional regulator n=1 Tax=Teredinibacter turnerae TaxID=2426 RepID=UPI0003FD52A6|nr:TetR/AcrR family transcriptional regulator [Teredinibacter turnerae]
MRNREEEILTKASELFSKHGFHAVGIDRIIEESNVAKMTFYKYFPSKDSLIHKVLEHREECLRLKILEQVSHARTPNGKLKSVFDWYDDWFSSATFYGCMFIKASEEFPDSQNTLKKVATTYRIWLAGLLEGILRELGARNAKKLSVLTVTLLDGLTVSSNMYVGDQRPSTKEAFKYVKSLIAA